MFLKNIELLGFKSFANKTTFHFKPGVVAIVGPNGCGKSNVVDAIRWVLGEANARSLRGEVMDDVIFSGSVEKGPLGMAEVGITIVNDDKVLPIEYSEVDIKRRLYRSGESEFLINKNNVRLRDIQELFTDTGIGKASYSVMEQGNVDVLLNNKPEERMYIFEEAAGITRYKMRIKESYNKLKATEENLIRLNLIISEVEKEYRNLEKQSGKALLFKRLKKEDVKYETLYNYERIQALRKRVSKNNTMLKELKDKQGRLKKEEDLLNNSIKEDIEKVRGLENKIVEIKSEIYKKEAELEAINSKSLHIKDRIYEIRNEISKKNHLMEKVQKDRVELEEKLHKLSREKESIQDLIQSQEEKLHKYLEEADYIDNAIQEGAEKVLNNTKEIEGIGESVGQLREELKSVIDRLLKEIDNVKSKHKGNERRKIELIKNIGDSIVKMDSTLNHHKEKLNDLIYSMERSSTGILIKQLSEEIEELRERLSELKQNIETIIEIQDELSTIIFGKESLHTQKEQMENSIEKLLKNERDLKSEIALINEELRKSRDKKDEFAVLIDNLHTDIARNRERQKYYEQDSKIIELEMEKNEESLQDVESEINTLDGRREKLQSDLNSLESQYNCIEDEKLKFGEETKNNNLLIEKIVEDIQKNESITGEKRNHIEKIVKSREALELNNAELLSKIETIIENFNESYAVSLELFRPHKKIGLQDIKNKREKVKEEIRSLGQVNLIAIEEFNEVKKRYDYLMAQKDDLEKAKDDVNRLISDTVKSAKELFMVSFEKVKRNFNSIFRRLFNGGETDLYLTDDRDIFSSGVEIIACPPGKSLKRRSLLSGGEKGLTAVALLFAIFMVRPSPFCMLDEVDHDLDEENILRFIKLLKEFTDTTQFIIITHNRRTLEFADVLYGITTEQVGVSKIVSLDLVEHVIE